MKTKKSITTFKTWFYSLSLLAMWLLFSSFPTSTFAATCKGSDYEAVPPFLSQRVEPNVLLVLDNSGSMNELAYHEVEGCIPISGTDRDAYTGYNEGEEYYGLFDPDRTYTYDNSAGKHFFKEAGDAYDDPGTTQTERASRPGQTEFSGNWLNWWTMRRIDVAKKVLTGGKVAPDNNDLVLEGMPTERDTRKIFNDCISTDGGCIETKNVYYTPFKQGIYSYFFNIDRADHLGGSSGEFTIMFSVQATTFDAASDKTGSTCVDAPGGDLSQAFTNGNNNSDTGYSSNGYVVAVEIESADQPVTGIIQNLSDSVRFGYMQFNYGAGPGEGYTRDNVAGSWDIDSDGTTDITWRYADGGRVRNFVGDTATTTDPHGDTVLQIVQNINQQNIQMMTPLEEVLWEAGRYFQQIAPAFQPENSPDTPPSNGVNYEESNTWDPYYFNDFDNGDGTFGHFVPCAKSFIILISDGAGNNNSGRPTSSWPTGANTDSLTGDGSGYLDDIAYNLHVKDLRDDVADFGKSTDTLDQIITLYTVFTFDDSNSAKAEMMKAARAGGFIDSNGDDDTGGTTSDTDPSAFVGDAEWDSDGDNVPDTYFEAEDGQEMETKIQEALTDILKKTSAGSSISVLSERATSGAVINQALFFPEKTFNSSYTVEWPGTLNAYWFYNSTSAQNIREDNVNPYYLDILTDNILDFKIDSNGNLEIDYYTPNSVGALNVANYAGTYQTIDDVNRIWEGGELLKDRAGSDRTIYGVDESDTMREFKEEIIPLDNNHQNFDDLFGLSSTFPSCLGNNDTDRAKNLISYTRGEADDFTSSTGSACKNRVVDASGNIWKLGDIINSTPVVVDYTGYSVLYTGSNDGMIHAFKVGKLRKDGLTISQAVKLCDSNTGTCTNAEIGKELWGFIPKNTMPYLKYLADPDFCHLFTVDLGTHFIDDGDQKILIGGMRFGGSTGGTYTQGGSDYWIGDTNRDGVIENDSEGVPLQVIPEIFGTCSTSTPENCIGLSSYFAIDITDPLNPAFLWEYTHPDLGFTYSGPSWIERGATQYVMFGSGPINYKGDAEGQDLKIFILEVDDSFNISTVHKVDGNSDTGFIKHNKISQFNDGFAGRMFTDGIDSNIDGKTDIVFFGVNNKSGGNWQGNVLAVVPTDDPPTDGVNTVNWTIETTFQSGQAPITSKVAYGDCFDKPFLYFGTGRWFYKLDEAGGPASDVNSLYGVGIADCMDAISDADASTKCNINISSAHANRLADCGATFDSGSGNNAWQYDGLDPKTGDSLKERVVSDPSFVGDIAFFTTATPSGDVCAFGGESRIFAFNCITGHTITTGCSADFTPAATTTSLLLQLSGGNIEEAHVGSSFTQEGGYATDDYTGLPPESGATPIPPAGLLTGEIILWIER